MAGKFVDVTLRLIDKMTSPLNSAGQALARQAKQITRAGKEIQSVGKSISKTGSSLTKSVTVPIASIGVAAVKTAADFEAGMSKVASISGDTGNATKSMITLADEMGLSYQKSADGSVKAMDILSAKALQMGAKTKFSATEAADAFSYMAMAGWETQQMMEGIEGIMYLAGATGEDLAQTSDIVTDALTAFGMQANETNRFVDVLAKTANKSNTNVSLMGETFKYVAPVAGALKFNVEDTAVAIGLMANSGIKASNAGTALRSLFTNLAKPTDQIQAAMDKLGISLTDSSGKMKSFDTLMREMRGSFSGLTEAEKAQYAATIAGKTGMSGLLAIVNASEGDFQKLTSEIRKSTGAAKGMYDVANDNLTGRLTVLKSTLESIAITLGNKLMPYVEKGVAKLQSLAEKFNALDDATLNTIIKVAAIAAAIGPAILIFGKMVLAVGNVVSVVGKVATAFGKFGTISAMLASPAGIVVAVLAAIAVAAVLVYKNWDKIKPVIDKVVKSLQPAIKIFKDMLSTCKETLAPIGSLFKKSFGSAIAESTGIVSKEFGSTSDIIKSFGQTCTKIMSAIAPIVKKAVEVIAEVLKKVIPVVASQIPKAVSIVSKVIKSAMKVIEKIAPVVKTVLSTIAKAMPMMQKRVSSTFNAILPIIKIAAKLLLKIGTVIGSVISKAVQAAMPVIQKFGTCFKTVFPVVAKIVIEKVGNITGIITKMQPVFEFVFSVAGKYVSALGERISGVFGGIMTTLGGVLDFITGVFTGNWKKAWEGVKNAFSGVFQSFAAIIKAPMNAVISLINKAISGINGISVDIPEGIPGVGGKHIGFNISTIPALAKGTQNWKGGIAQVSEEGGEIIDLPKGTRVYPHDKSVQKAYKDGAKAGGGGVKIIIPKLADSIIVREEADIDKIVSKFADKLEKVSSNLGGGEIEYIY